MDTSIRKEIRSLLPIVIMTVAVVTIASLLFNGSDATGIVLFIYGACATLIAASCFGNEFLSHTMPLLLIQPTTRGRLWADKMKALGGSLAITWFVTMLDIALFIRGEGRAGSLEEAAFVAFGVAIVAFCSAPLFTLLIRNIVGAMGAAVAVPWGLFMLFMGADWLVSRLFSQPEPFFSELFSAFPYLFIVPLLALYSAATFWLGLKTFMNMQLMDAQSTEIRLPSIFESTLGRAFLALLPNYSGPTASLIRKEFLLQRTTFILTGSSCLLMIVAGLIFEMYPSSEIAASLLFLPFWLTVILVPLLGGGLAFAEERNIGLFAWHLTMPPSRFKQWSVKMAVSIFVCAALGVALPLAMNQVTKSLISEHQGLSIDFLSDSETVTGWVLGYLFGFSLILYAASISIGAFRAIIASLGIVVGIGTLCALTAHFLGDDSVQYSLFSWLSQHFRGNDELYRYYTMIALIEIACISILTFGGLTFVNFRRGELSTRHRCTQLAALGSMGVVFTTIVVTLIFATNRTWH